MSAARELSPRVQRAIVLALVVLPVFVLFAPVLFQDRSLAFRDTAVFYYPLFEWIEQQWQQSELPLWNPHVNYGTPLVGDGTSSVFYPGKLLLLLPLEFSWKFKLYVVAHVLLAAVSGYWSARRWGLSQAAAALAAVAFSCGGSVLFQYCNVVYLVSAAWLPLALLAAESMLTQHVWRAAGGLAIALSMMVLGGDPQMAYHVGLAATGYAIAIGWSHLAATTEARGRWQMPLRLAGLLTTAALLALALSAVQVLPSAEATRLSDRASYHEPRNIYEAADVLATHENGGHLASQGLFRTPPPETHAASIYEFSFAPWHLFELIWPGNSGDYFPQFRRWLTVVPGEPRMWSPSAYFGLLPLALAVASLRFRNGTLRVRWLSWTSLLAVLGSFGVFGVGWLLRLPLYAAGQAQLAEPLPHDAVGGVYWFCATLLPGYAYFRFPAKLLTFAAWPLCLLAGVGLDRLRRHDMPRVRTFFLATAIGSGLLLLVLLFAWPLFAWFTTNVQPDVAFGPFDRTGAFRQLAFSLLHAVVVGGVLYALLRSRKSHEFRYGTIALVAIMAIELVVAQSPLIATAPSSHWSDRPVLAEMLSAADAPLRVRPPLQNDLLDPHSWQQTSSPERIEELAAADRHSMNTNHCLAGPIDAVDSLTSQRLADYAWFYKRQAKNDEAYWGNYWLMPQSTENIASPADDPWQPLEHRRFTQTTRLKLFQHRDPFPRAWIVHEITQLPELDMLDPHALALRGGEIVERRIDGQIRRRDLRREAVVEHNGVLLPSPAPLVGRESCRIIASGPHRVEIETELNSAGLLVLGDTFYPGWTAHTESAPLTIVRTNRMFRGVLLPAGKHRITFEYRPRSVYLGAGISGVAWLALLTFVVVRRKSRRP